jgi:hypothetical protein
MANVIEQHCFCVLSLLRCKLHCNILHIMSERPAVTTAMLTLLMGSKRSQRLGLLLKTAAQYSELTVQVVSAAIGGDQCKGA